MTLEFEHPRLLWLGALLRGLSLWECRAAQSRQARPEEAQEPSSGPAEGALALFGRAGRA